jgi:signal transduction histidine kinase/CheY-like chemotaxis protein
MFPAIKSFFDETDLMPHGMCLLWRPEILWTHVVADGLTAIAYLTIPAALIYFAHQRRDFPHVWILYLFGSFIVWCGLTHVISIWTFWEPAYGLQAVVKLITAAVSLTTAFMLWPLMPRALAVPSLRELQIKNDQLEKEISDRLTIEDRLQELAATLERRVHERTRELTDANEHLHTEIERRRRSEEQLLKAKSEAEGASRAKSVFLAGMSHELRSPLNAILGFAQMLDQVYPQGLDARQREYLANIQTSGSMLLELIDRLLDLSMFESDKSNIKVEPTDVTLSLDKARAILAPMAENANVALSVSADDSGPIVVVADPTRLLQILVNLGSNAIKYNRAGGRVDISVLLASEEDVVIRFADTGIGIPARYRRQIFQPFNRLDQEKTGIHGAGIGLALSKRLAQAMGADLTFESSEGHGSTFDLTLQRAQQFMFVPGEAAGAPLPFPQCRVLYVDDDLRSRSLLDMYARHRPELIVAHASDAGEIKTQIAAESPDVIVVDINMLIWKGADLRSAILRQQEAAGVRIIGVATIVDPSTRRYAEDNKMVTLIPKPIAFRDLVQAIGEAML